LQDRKVAALLSEVVADSETSLAATDYDNVVARVAVSHGVRHPGAGTRGRESVQSSVSLLLKVTAPGRAMTHCVNSTLSQTAGGHRAGPRCTGSRRRVSRWRPDRDARRGRGWGAPARRRADPDNLG